jgi:hypothetical protein
MQRDAALKIRMNTSYNFADEPIKTKLQKKNTRRFVNFILKLKEN